MHWFKLKIKSKEQAELYIMQRKYAAL